MPQRQSQAWHRLCVDVDAQGHVVGASVERHLDDKVLYVMTFSELDLGPFDTPAEIADLLLDAILARWGLVQSLF